MNKSCQTTVRWVSPAPYNTPLGLAHSNVISDDEELDLVYLGWMLSSKLLLGKTEVEHISRIVSMKWSVDQLRGLVEGLLDNDKSANTYLRTGLTGVIETYPSSLSTSSIARRTCVGPGEAKILPHTAAYIT